MINIIEARTNKMPGLTSLFVKFDYNASIVEAIKTLPNYTYDKKTYTWELPITSLSKLLGVLNPLDDIQLSLMKDEDDVVPEIYTLGSYKVKPFKHQEEAIQYGLNNDKFLLLDAPGLGKTLSLTYLAQELHEREGLEHCLVICGINTLKMNWRNEILKTSDLPVRILGEKLTKAGRYTIGSVNDRINDLKKPIEEFFVITNVESLRNEDLVKAILKGPNKFDFIICDEVHKCFDYDTLIDTNLGNLKIGDIVTKNLECKVKSYNLDSNLVEFNDIIAKYKIPNDKPLLHLEFEDNDIIYSLNCTPEHEIYTSNRGYVMAKDLTEFDDIVYSKN